MVDSLIGSFDSFCFALLGFDWLIYSLIHWLVDWLMHCLFDRLNGLIWFDRFVCLIDGLVGRLNLVWFRVVGCLIDWLFGWFVDFILCGLVGWVFDCLVPWLIPLARYSLLSDWLVNLTLLFCVGWLHAWLVGSFVYLICWSIVWMVDWMIDWSIVRCITFWWSDLIRLG